MAKQPREEKPILVISEDDRNFKCFAPKVLLSYQYAAQQLFRHLGFSADEIYFITNALVHNAPGVTFYGVEVRAQGKSFVFTTLPVHSIVDTSPERPDVYTRCSSKAVVEQWPRFVDSVKGGHDLVFNAFVVDYLLAYNESVIAKMQAKGFEIPILQQAAATVH